MPAHVNDGDANATVAPTAHAPSPQAPPQQPQREMLPPCHFYIGHGTGAKKPVLTSESAMLDDCYAFPNTTCK